MTRHSLLAAAALLLLPAALLAQAGNGCLACHAKLDGPAQAPAAAFGQDIHGQFGLACRDCHGGNPATDDVDAAHDKTFKGVPKRAAVPALCGGCHADAAYIRRSNPALRVDQLDQYWTSRHGALLKAGDDRVAVCTDCHGAHGIQTAKLPKSPTFPWNIPQTCGRCHADKALMAGYKIPADQLEDYRQSVHAETLFEKKDLSAPVCNDCHGNHGAFPPEAGSVGAVCRQCHPATGELFLKSPHKKAFDEMGVGECEACHGNHKIVRPTRAMLGTGDGAVCGPCHEAGSKGAAAAARLRELVDGFAAGFQAAGGLLDGAERKGVDVNDARFKLQDVNTLLVTAENATHGLDVAAIAKTVEDGRKTLAAVEAEGRRALDEAAFRRRGLAVTVVFCVLLAVALFLKVRRMAAAR